MGLATTPWLLALVRMREECKRRRRVSSAVDNDRYRRVVLVLVLVMVVVMVVKARLWEMGGDRGRAADIRLVRLRAGGQVGDERRHASGGIRDRGFGVRGDSSGSEGLRVERRALCGGAR